MKITFLVRNLSKKFSATTMVLLRHAYQLQKKGHSVTIIIPADRGDCIKKETFFKQPNFLYKFRKILNLTRGGKVQLKCFWMEVNDFNLPIIEVPDLNEKHIPDGDIIIAGSVWMLDAVNSYSSRKGKKFYLIQGYDLYSEINKKRYKFPIKKIAVSTYLKNRIEEVIGKTEIEVVNNGVDIEFFNADGRKYNIPPARICMVYYYKAPYEVKAVSDGVKVFEMAKKEISEIKLIMFGTKKGKDIPLDTEFYISPSRKKISDIYRSCDIFVSPSKEEACQLPPMEAMACGCAVVATNVGGIPDYTIGGKTALVSSPGDLKGILENLLFLLKNPEKFIEIAKSGNQYIKNFSWEKVNLKLEKILFSS